jgi:O-antigen/teichoic acid export membrane protein
MKKILKTIKNIALNEFVYIISDILIKAIAFISLPFFLNIMTAEDFGGFSLYQTYISIFCVFFGLNVSSAIVRYYIERVDSKKYLATAIWIVVIAGLIFSGLILGVQYLFGFFKMGYKVLVIILISTIFNCLFTVCKEVIRSEKNAKLYGIFSVLNSVLSTGIGLILIYTNKDNLALWRLISVCISSMVIGGSLTIRLICKYGIKGNLQTTKYLLSFSVPLIPYTLSTTILAQVNQLFLSKNSLSQVGIYSFSSNLAMIIYIISMALNRSLQPNLFEALRDNKDYKNQLKRNVGIFYFFYLSFIFGNDVLIWIFGNKEYLASSKVIPVLALGYGYCFLYSIYSNFLYYYKKNKLMSIYAVISAFVIVGLDLFLIPLYGYFGAAYSAMLSYVALFILGYWYVKYRLKISVFSFKIISIFQVCLIFPVVFKIIFGAFR